MLPLGYTNWLLECISENPAALPGVLGVDATRGLVECPEREAGLESPECM